MGFLEEERQSLASAKICPCSTPASTHSPNLHKQNADWPPTVALPGTVSHGTLRDEDLARTFLEVLGHLDFERHQAFREDLPTIANTVSTEEYYEKLSEFVQTLFDELNDLAPEGYYFGSTEGDGSDFGFWEYE